MNQRMMIAATDASHKIRLRSFAQKLHFLPTLLIFIALQTPLTAALAPDYPPPAAPMPTDTAITAREVKFSVDGKTVRVGEFNRERSLNGTWRCSGLESSATPFSPTETKGFEAVDFNDAQWDKIPVPMNWFLHYNYYKNGYNRALSYVRGFYRTDFELTPAELQQRRILLHFEFIGYEAELWINGKKAGAHHGDFVPWTVDITDLVKPGRNQLTMRVLTDFGVARGSLDKAVRTYGSQWSASNIKGGIWGNVTLKSEPEIRFSRLLVTPHFNDKTIEVDYTIENHRRQTVPVSISCFVTSAIKHDANQLEAQSKPDLVSLKPGVTNGRLTVKLNNPQSWSPHSPYLYFATAALRENGKPVSVRSERFGFREFKIKDGKFHLNGKRIYLFGENLPSVRFTGYNKSDDDTKRLKTMITGFKSIGCNILRNAHMPITETALDIADEVGMMIYDEWSWSFTKKIDEPEFERRNRAEIHRWLERDYNRPCVVMWSCGNEVAHMDNPPVRRQLDKQVAYVRDFDRSGRPIGSFSASATWVAYGKGRLNTDFLDHHSYLGNGGAPWTWWNKDFNQFYAGSLADYPHDDKQLAMPYIVWECVGFSWGGKTDPKFKINDIDRYAAYVRAGSTRSNANGIGYSGTLGLARALRASGMTEAKRIYGKRLLELMRQDARIDGFAPWFHAYNLDAATLWNQPIYPGLRNSRALPPRNLFCGEKQSLEYYIVNSTNETIRNARLQLFFYDGNRTIPCPAVTIAQILPWQMVTLPAEFTVPDGLERRNIQLRLRLTCDAKELGRNFYDIYAAPREVLTEPLKTTKKIVLLDVGDKRDLEETGKVLNALGLKYTISSGAVAPTGADIAVIPASRYLQTLPGLNSDALFGWIKNGGRLVILEQRSENGSLLGNTAVRKSPNTFVDLVYPAHPVFQKLTQDNFDTWENPSAGHAITYTLAPFQLNAIAVRGPFLGGQNVECAALEAVYGKGRLFWSQFNAVSLWGKDSVASTYLRNIFTYITTDGKLFPAKSLDSARLGEDSIPADALETIDLRAAANRSFTDEKPNDGKGGWTDQGENDFRNMPLGRQQAGGVFFDIIDPARNNDKSCLIVRGSARPDFPEAIRGISVNRKFRRIFFLHASAWRGTACGRYRMNYDDGKYADMILSNGLNIGDWWECSFIRDAIPGIQRPNRTKENVGTYVGIWENPRPNHKIISIDFLSAEAADRNDIDFLPGYQPVPILVAATGEKVHPNPVEIAGIWKGSKTGTSLPATISYQNTTGPDGQQGRFAKLSFPAVSDNSGTPFAMIRFAPGKRTADYRYLTGWIKPLTNGAIDLVLPEKNWKGNFSSSLMLDSAKSGQWKHIRLVLSEKIKEQQLRGELFIFNGKNRDFHWPRPAVEFLAAGFALE